LKGGSGIVMKLFGGDVVFEFRHGLAPFEQSEIGPDLFMAACNMGLEDMVSKRADRQYRAGRSKDRIKIKNREHPTYRRVQDQF